MLRHTASLSHYAVAGAGQCRLGVATGGESTAAVSRSPRLHHVGENLRLRRKCVRQADPAPPQ